MSTDEELFRLAWTVECRQCGAGYRDYCMAPTGLAASVPCPVRMADARDAATKAAA